MLDNILSVVRHAQHTLDIKKPEILTGMGIVGFAATVADAIKRTPYAMLDLEDAEYELYESEREPSQKEIIVTKAKAVVPHYISTMILGTSSIACFVGSVKESNKRIAASVAAYMIANDEARKLKNEVAFLEDKVAEQDAEIVALQKPTKGKSKKLNKEEEESKSKEVSESDIKEVIPQAEEVLMCDKMSKRYFYSSPLKIKEIEAKLNRDLLLNMFVPLNDFYYEVGLSNSGLGEYFGWEAGDEINFTFSSSLTSDNRPCVDIDYDVITHMSNRVNY